MKRKKLWMLYYTVLIVLLAYFISNYRPPPWVMEFARITVSCEELAKPIVVTSKGYAYSPRGVVVKLTLVRGYVNPSLRRIRIAVIFMHKGELVGIYFIEREVAPGQVLPLEVKGGITFKVPDAAEVRIFLDKREIEKFNLTLTEGGSSDVEPYLIPPASKGEGSRSPVVDPKLNYEAIVYALFLSGKLYGEKPRSIMKENPFPRQDYGRAKALLSEGSVPISELD